MKKILLFSIVSQLLFFSGLKAQTYTTGQANWTNSWVQNAGTFDFTGGVGLYSFNTSTNDGVTETRFITTDGTAGGTATTLKPGQKLTIRVAGQDGGGRTGITTGGRIGFSLRTNGSLFYDGGTAGVYTRYDASSILRVEYVGGNSTAQFTNSGGTSTGNMPNFTNFKAGVTYDVEVISDKEFNLVIGGTRDNIQAFANGGGPVSQIAITNISSNMDGLFTNLAVSNTPVNLTANSGETFTVTGVISNNGATVNTVQKNGIGTVILSGTNTYTGATTVNAGTLQITKPGYTATITTTAITMAFSPAPSVGTFAVLPGALSGSQTFNATGLAANQTANFNAATGIVTVGSITPASTVLPAFTTTYGTVSTAQTVVITGTNLTGNIITSTAPTGFEVSSDGTNYASTASFPAGGGSLRVRLKSNANVIGTNYNGQTINLTNGTANVSVTTAISGNSVTTATLTINGIIAENKVYDGMTTATLGGTPAYVNLQNGELFSVAGTPVANFSSSAVGPHPVSVTGYIAPTSNYTVSQPTGLSATIMPVEESTAAFRSKVNGNFSVASTWEYDQGGNNYTGASNAPTSTNNVSILHNVTLDQDFTIGSSQNLIIGTGGTLVVNPARTLTVTGTADFGAKLVTFKSDGTGTGSLGPVDGSLLGATNVTVERYIPVGPRAWRLLSATTKGSQTIRQSWQELADTDPALYINPSLPGYGTQITGTGTLAAATLAGFDNTSSGAALLTWSGTAWAPVGNTKTTAIHAAADPDKNKAYFLYIRGDRSKGVSAATNNSSATTLRTNGAINWGDLESATLPAGSFGLLGNPYPSAIDFTSLTPSSPTMSDKFYIWDSKASNNGTLGAYQTFSGTDGYLPTRTGSYGPLFPDPGAHSNTTIESGQAFFVIDNSNSGTITFHENSKITSPGSLGFRPATPVNQLIKIDSRLYVSGGDMVDANVVVFDPAYVNAVDEHDAQKLTNPGENFAIARGNSTLVIEGRQPVSASDIIPFKLWNLRQQSYEFEFVASNLGSSGLVAELEDDWLHTGMPVSLNAATRVSFTIDANAGSSAADRFRLVFRPSAPVPVSFISISASRTGAAVKVEWKVAAETNMRRYEIERSTDGRNFTTAGIVTATGAGTAELSYQFTDAGVPAGTVFYRVKSLGAAGEIKYSSIVKVMDVKPGFAVWPNPVEDGIVNLQFNNQAEGRYTVRLLSNAGQDIFTTIAAHSGGNSTQVLNLPAGIAKGAYQIEIIAPDKTTTTQTLFINSK